MRALTPDHRSHGGTGFFNEFLAGTVVTNPASVFRIIQVFGNTGDFFITFPAIAGRRYRVEESSDLISWTPLYDLGVWPASEPLTLSSSSTGSRYFLRVRVGS